MVECDVCGADIDDEGYIVQFEDTDLKRLWCPSCHEEHHSKQFEVLFHWGGDEPDPPCPLVHHAIIKISAESREPIDLVVAGLGEVFAGEVNVSVSVTIGREP